MVDRAAGTALGGARRLREAVEAHPGGRKHFKRILRAVDALEAAVHVELRVEHTIGLSGRRGATMTLEQLRRQVTYFRRKFEEAQKEHEHLRDRFHNGIALYWFVHAGLSDPSTSVRSVADWCRDFNAGVPALGFSSVTAVRDALCETLKAMAAERLAQFCADPPRAWILIKQVHDEASMRLRS
ncbi:MAG: hypothetical protein GY772_02755, partial [bacterium]|nr:hypothetical protein [bacterium]